ncbi:hypothetical protein [Sulfitobacter geojensis]|uniref:hypothetical protein n=1 Tax=Sulfitobacter geojensis TaxID=1342299 RepID=UPI0036DAAF48
MPESLPRLTYLGVFNSVVKIKKSSRAGLLQKWLSFLSKPRNPFAESMFFVLHQDALV